MLNTRKTTPFLVSAAPAAFLLASAPAFADTTVSGTSTTPLVTASAGSVTVSSTGALNVPTGTGVTVNSNSTVTVNSGGTIAMGSADGATGVAINPGVTSTITNAGTISVTESFTAADADGNGIADGPIASASNRYGIHVLSGGTMTGGISNTGTITVEGLNSAGIANDGTISGDLSSTGTIAIKGDNSVGIRTGNVNGNVVAEGTVTVAGEGAQALVVDGNVGGQVKIGGTLAQSTSYTTDASTTQTLSRTALHSGKAAVEIDGNVAGGVLVYTPSSTSVSDQSTGSIQAYGNSPAMQIGGASDITIGGGTTNVGTYSLGVDGSVSASASYSSTDAYGIVIGGKGGNVTLTKGIGVSGTVTATTVDSSATALLINAGSTVGTLYNSGTIKSVISSPGIGASYAIRDLSGTLSNIENTGFITVTGSSEDTLAAIDLSANTSGVTIKQDLNATDAASQTTDKAASGYNPDTATVYTAITGNIYTGSGNDTIDIESGKVTGNGYLGAGNDSVTLADDAKWIGNIDFGTGTATMSMAGNSRFTGTMALNDQTGTLTLADSARWLGTVTGGSALTVNVNGGVFGANATGTTTIHALNVASGGTLRVYVDGATGTSSKLVADTVSFASGSKISATVSSLSQAEGTYTVVSAGSLSGISNIATSALDMPVLYNGTITTAGNDVLLTIARKTATELGLTAPQAAAYSAILGNAAANSYLESSLLQVADTATLQSQFNQMLPDYAGGTFDIITRGARLAAQHVADDSSIFTISDVGGWLEPIYFHGTHRSSTDAGYTDHAFGLSAGIERKVGSSRVGASLLWFSGTVDTGGYQSVKANDYELGLFWRRAAGPLYTWARLGLGKSTFTSARTFTGEVDSTAISYTAAGRWKGTSISGTGGISYAVPLGEHFRIKPKAVLEYFRLHENAYTETGSTPLILSVDSRNSSALNGTTTLVASWSAGQGDYENRPFTLELEAGRRSRLSGHLGATTATFGSGDSFTLTPTALPSAWVGQLSVLAGGLDYTWKLSTGAERLQGGGTSYSLRASLSIAM
jgi:hypothetical protein